MYNRIFGIRVTKHGYIPGVNKVGPFQTRMYFEDIVKICLGLERFSEGDRDAMIMLGDIEAVYLTRDIIAFIRNNPTATKKEIMAAGIKVEGLIPTKPLPMIPDLTLVVTDPVPVMEAFEISFACPSIESEELEKIKSEIAYEYNTARFEKISQTSFKPLLVGQGVIVAKHKRLIKDIPLVITAVEIPKTLSFINDAVFNNVTEGDVINFSLELVSKQGTDMTIGDGDITISSSANITVEKFSPSSFNVTAKTAGEGKIDIAYRGDVLTLSKSFTVVAAVVEPEPEVQEEEIKDVKKK